MKPRILPEELSTLTFVEYRKSIIKEFKRMEMECTKVGDSVHFILMSEWNFPDMPGKEIPFLAIGTFRGTWDKYYKDFARKRQQKDFAIGNLSFGKKVSSDQELVFELKHGRVKTKGLNILEKVILGKIGLIPILLQKGETADQEDDDVQLDTTFANAATISSLASEELKPSLQNEVKEKLKKENDALQLLVDKFQDSFIKFKTQMKGASEKKDYKKSDLKLMQKLKEDYSQFLARYQKSPLPLQKRFASTHNSISKNGEKLKLWAAVLKSENPSLSRTLADTYFQTQQKRNAKDAEVKQMNESLKNALDHFQVKVKTAGEKKNLLKAIYYSAQTLGPGFQMKQIELVHEKIITANK